jgi:signal transduction histidine kinase
VETGSRRKLSIRFRLWPIVSASFAALLALVLLFAWSLAHKTSAIDERAAAAHRQYQAADDAITNVRSDVYRAALLARDTPYKDRSPSLQADLNALRADTEAETKRLASLLGPPQRKSLSSLRRLLAGYWNSLAVPNELLNNFSSTEPDRRGELRDAVLTIAEQIDALNEASITQQEAETGQNRESLRHFALKATAVWVALSLFVAVASTASLASLERRSERERQRAEEAEIELRRLSQMLVTAQEEERKNISRELHDEIGQLLTGLRMELGTLSPHVDERTFLGRLDSVKRLTEDALRTVRNLALLLRPSMLDDLGLAPALQSQAKDFSRRLGVPVTLEVQGSLKRLSETQRICLYRVVQEALTNSARHAAASHISISLVQRDHSVEVVIRDDGRGFDEQGRVRGLGLVGMEERIRALRGHLSIHSEPGSGTELHAFLPLESGAAVKI